MKVHIGKEIEKKFQESGLKLGVFAERINTGERNVYSIFKREDINAEMLKTISDVLGFNFFKIYERELDGNSWCEPRDAYAIQSKTMSINISLTTPMEGIEKLPDLLIKIKELAKTMGYHLT